MFCVIIFNKPVLTFGAKFSIFTVPTVLLFAEGKEVIREARFISMDMLEEKI
ncbi:MAG: hypothetical protein PWQ59_881 [Thermoanaerobacterium sp.]|nr:hypothetical protein [Thermoanaerobacterium sp.]MDK2806595.1 hypothetical protein [Thermoanaerobacterium sp.]